MRLSRAILAFILICFIGQIIYYYPNLPEIIASHYNASGEPDSRMSKNGFLLMEGFILLLVIFQFTFLPFIIEKLPNSVINLPNKEFWLSQEKRRETFLFIRIFFEWFSIGILGLFISVNEFVFRANLNHSNLSNSIWISLIIFIIFVGFCLTKLYLKFRKPL